MACHGLAEIKTRLGYLFFEKNQKSVMIQEQYELMLNNEALKLSL